MDQENRTLNYLLFITFLKQLSVGLALIMLDIPLFVILLLTLILYLPIFFTSATFAYIIEFVYNIARPVLYIAGIIATAKGPQDFFAVAFYVIAGLQAIDIISKAIYTIVMLIEFIKEWRR